MKQCQLMIRFVHFGAIMHYSIDIGWTKGIRAMGVVLVPEPRIYGIGIDLHK